MKINTDKKIYYAVCTTLAVFLALIMIYREIPRSTNSASPEIREKLIPEEITALYDSSETNNTQAVSAEAENENPVSVKTDFAETDISSDAPAAETGSSELINLNTADQKTLMSLKGIGEKKAQSIIEYRNTYGSFKCVDDLSSVPGIGKKTVDSVRDYVTV